MCGLNLLRIQLTRLFISLKNSSVAFIVHILFGEIKVEDVIILPVILFLNLFLRTIRPKRQSYLRI